LKGGHEYYWGEKKKAAEDAGWSSLKGPGGNHGAPVRGKKEALKNRWGGQVGKKIPALKQRVEEKRKMDRKYR